MCTRRRPIWTRSVPVPMPGRARVPEPLPRSPHAVARPPPSIPNQETDRAFHIRAPLPGACPALWGAQQAAQDINAAGGVLGRPLAIVARDDMAQPPKAIQGVTELLDSEKV